jgi:hypothetical protein
MFKLIQFSPTAWAFETPFKFWNIFSTQNNGVICKSNNCLVAVNAPQLNEELLEQIQTLEKQTNAKLTYIIGTDWHHMFVEDWLREFPGSKLILSGERAKRMHPKLVSSKTDSYIVSRESLSLPGINSDDLQLIPWQGFEGVYYEGNDEKHRGEWSVWMPSSKTLFIFDVILPALPSLFQSFSSLTNIFQPKSTTAAGAAAVEEPKYRPNFGAQAGRIKGFASVLDENKVKESIQRLLHAGENCDRIIMSHGSFKSGAFVEGKVGVERVLKILRETTLD